LLTRVERIGRRRRQTRTVGVVQTGSNGEGLPLNLKALLIASSVVLLLSGPALATTKWTAATSPSLTAHSDEVESDRSLFAVCPIPGIVDIYVGANDQVGKGQGETVKLRLESDGKSATVIGASRRSYNSEMTGGTELVTRIHPDDDFFKVLATGKPVKISGSLSKPVTWNDKGMADAVKKFVKSCAGR
jgi:hypothetical protein